MQGWCWSHPVVADMIVGFVVDTVAGIVDIAVVAVAGTADSVADIDVDQAGSVVVG